MTKLIKSTTPFTGSTGIWGVEITGYNTYPYLAWQTTVGKSNDLNFNNISIKADKTSPMNNPVVTIMLPTAAPMAKKAFDTFHADDYYKALEAGTNTVNTTGVVTNVTLVSIGVMSESDIVAFDMGETVGLELTVFLEGVTPTTGSATMTNYIQEPDYTFYNSMFLSPKLPITDPYSVGVIYSDINDSEGAATKVVDWIKVEIWNNVNFVTYPYSYEVLETQALLLKPDGSIVDIDGSIPRFMPQSGTVWVVIKHRNHLALMSQPFSDLNMDTEYDFSADLNKAYRQDALDPNPMVLKNGVWCMWAGDLDDNGIIDLTDANNIRADFYAIKFDEYLDTDIDMNGITDYIDVQMAEKNFNSIIYSPVYYFNF
jgi:hypothetical protein